MAEYSVLTTGQSRRARQAVLALLVCACFAVQSSPGWGADAKGTFAVKGSGFETCQTYSTSREAKDPRYLAFRSWLNGYLTAYNQLVPETYDIAAGANLEQMAAQLDQFCRRNPTKNFVTAASTMIAAYRERRLRADPQAGAAQPSTPVTADRATRRKAQQALKDKGYYDGPVDGLIGPGTRTAIRKYQQDQNLSVTGQIDQQTLSRLLQ
jgi:hypothetical protein